MHIRYNPYYIINYKIEQQQTSSFLKKNQHFYLTTKVFPLFFFPMVFPWVFPRRTGGRGEICHLYEVLHLRGHNESHQRHEDAHRNALDVTSTKPVNRQKGQKEGTKGFRIL